LEIEMDEEMETSIELPSGQPPEADADPTVVASLKAMLGRPKRRVLVDSDDD
jgi:hypothetical protein